MISDVRRQETKGRALLEAVRRCNLEDYSLEEEATMCRNIKTLFNFDPPATELEIRDASLQFVRKLSGLNVPSSANDAAFERAVQDVTAAARVLIRSLVTTAGPRYRDPEVP